MTNRKLIRFQLATQARDRDVAALHALQASRPLRPLTGPLPFDTAAAPVSASELDAARYRARTSGSDDLFQN